MKNLLTLLAFVVTLFTFAQAPQGFNYQATVRNSSGQLLTNQIVLVKFNILQNSSSGAVVYSENQTANTDDLGHINLVVGQGTAVTGTFSGINWGTGNYYLGIELNSGSGYNPMGTTQLLSVPYALFAQNSTTVIPCLQQILDAGNIATKTINTTEDASLRINTIGGSASGNFYYGIRSQIDGTNGSNRAILAASNGVSTGTNTGLATYASNGATNSGIYARAYDSTTGSNYGVYGVANGSTGADNRAVAGYADAITATGKNYGLTGVARGSEVFNIAVGAFAELGNTTNGINYGVVARASSTNTNGSNIGVYSSAANGATNLAGYFSGDVTITGTLVQPSDRKLKKDIKPIESALSKINQLSPVTYFYNASSNINLPSKLQYGFIAQELESVFPELVINQSVQTPPTEKSDGGISEIKELDENLKTNSTPTISKEEFKGINYTGLISILTEGIKEQQVLIDELKKQNELLKERINVIEKKLK